MAKPKVVGENKEQKFKRLATARTQKVLRDLRVLGNCSNTISYAFSKEDVTKIFGAVDGEVERVKGLFERRRERKATDFSLK